MKKYRLICMSFDGDYQQERPVFDSIEDAWEYSNDLGSKWFFYPFHFVVTESYSTVRSAGQFLEHLIGLRVKTVARMFEEHSQKPEMQNADAEYFAISI